MASFYNRYYRYYKPYPPALFGKPCLMNPIGPSSSLLEKEASPKMDRSNDTFEEKQKKSQGDFSFGPLHFKNPLFTDVEEPIFEILGIQLYLDDIIILGLLFFLYQEGVQDEMLFIALILLLLG